jgi:hypothetical protein
MNTTKPFSIKDIILIDKDPIRCHLWKLVLEKAGLNLFTPEDNANPYYLLKDIGHYLLLLDLNTLSSSKPKLEENLNLPKNPLLLLGTPLDLETYAKNIILENYFPGHEVIGELQYPLSPNTLLKLLHPYLTK